VLKVSPKALSYVYRNIASPQRKRNGGWKYQEFHQFQSGGYAPVEEKKPNIVNDE